MIGIFRKFFRFSGDQAKLFYQGLAITLLHAIFEAMRLPAIAIVLGAILDGTVSMNTVWISLGFMLVSIIGCTACRASTTMKQTVGGYTVATNKRVDIGERLKYIPMGYFNDNSLGYITSVTTNTCENLQDVATRVIMLTTQGILTTAMFTLAILIYDWRVGLLMIVGILAFFGVNTLMLRQSHKISPRKTESDSRIVSAALEYVQGIGVVRSYNLDENANKTMDRAIRDNTKVNIDMEKTFVPYSCAQSIVLKLFGVGMVFLSVALYIGGTMELLTCLLFIIASFLVLDQLNTAGIYSALLRVLDLSIDKVDDLFHTPVMDIDGKAIKPEDMTIKGEEVTSENCKCKLNTSAKNF